MDYKKKVGSEKELRLVGWFERTGRAAKDRRWSARFLMRQGGQCRLYMQHAQSIGVVSGGRHVATGEWTAPARRADSDRRSTRWARPEPARSGPPGPASLPGPP